MPRTLGVVTIGASPRDDVVPDIAGHLPPASRVIEAGALDEVPLAALPDLAPRADDPPGDEQLVSRGPDGTQVRLSRARLLPLLDGALRTVRDRGAGLALLLCTGSFPELRPPLPVVTAERLLMSTAGAFAPERTLAVICPVPEQRDHLAARWAPVARRVLVEAASPYGPRAEVRAAAARLRDRAAEGESILGLLDCVGYDLDHQAAAAGVLDAPVLVPRAAMGHLLAQAL